MTTVDGMRGSVGSSPLVGRARELAALRTVLRGRRGGPAVVAIAGDPGIGKTRLLTEWLTEARRSGQLVLVGRAAEFERTVPFGVLRNAMEDHVLGSRPDSLAATDLQLLPSAFRTLAAVGAAADPGLLAGERYRLHRAIRTLVEHIAEPGGLVLALDDLHWADDSSLELLDHLLRHPPRAPVVLALAYRPRQASARLLNALAEATGRGLATTIEVGPLTAAEAGDLLPAHLGPAQQAQLVRAAGGNPFYLDVLARKATLETRALGELLEPPAPSELLETASRGGMLEALAGEFATLDPRDLLVVHAAAVAGDECDPGLLGAVAGLPESEVLVALEELVQRDIVRPGQAPGRFRFRHPLLRSAAYSDAGSGWRFGAHARAAATLGDRRAPLDVRAPHVEASAATGDLAAVDLLRAAAVQALPATPAAAAHWLGSALRLLPEEPAVAAVRLELLHLRGRALGVTGRLGESRDILGEIVRRLPAGTDERLSAAGFLAVLQNLIGNHAEARALLGQELAALPRDRPAAGALRVVQTLTDVMYGPSGAAEAGEAIRLSRSTGDRPLLAFALSVGVVANHAFDTTHPHTAAWLDEAVRLVDALPDSELAGRLDLIPFLAWGELFRERFTDARRHLSRAVQVARATGQSHLIGILQMLRGAVATTTGRLAEAVEYLDDAMEAAVLTGTIQTQARVLGYRCWVSVWRGDLAEAIVFGEQGATLAARGERPDWQAGPLEGYLGFARYAAGDPATALELLQRSSPVPDRKSRSDGGTSRPVWQARRYQWLAAAAAATGDVHGAAHWAAEASKLPAAPDLPRRVAFIQLAHVHATRRTDPTTASAHATHAAAAFHQAGDLIGAAQAHVYAAAALRDLGATRDSERHIAGAQRGFAACGATPRWLEKETGIALFAPAFEPGEQIGRISQVPQQTVVLPLRPSEPTPAPAPGQPAEPPSATESVRAIRGQPVPNGVLATEPSPDDRAVIGALAESVSVTRVESTLQSVPRLTPRELSVLRLLAESLTAAAIARRLDLSTGTVHKHLGRLYRKFGTTDRLATVLRAREAGLLPDTGH
ncbi:helix-turn-helix transcriptional regulator [Actinoplanes sp. NPDC051859]|uniref:helix-turn-helix transcriptional regulator n=1 Tax=Actinoplanes sp. NPDC051859 TaxID=3363909 RepID=UPI003794F7D3